MCAAEIEINRRLAPEIYLGTAAVSARPRRQTGAGRGRRSGRRRHRLAGRHAPLRRGRPARPHGRARRADAGADGGAGRPRRRLPRRPGAGHAASPGPTTIAARWRPTSASCASRAIGSTRRPPRRWPTALPGALEPFVDLVARRAGGRRGAALPWRSASAQHRADRRQAGAVRRHRVLRANRQHRRALRSRLRADGPLRARPAAAGQPAAERMAVAHRRAAEAPHDEALALLPHVPVAPRLRPRLRRASSAALGGKADERRPRLPAHRARLPAAGAAATAGDRRPVGQRQDHAGAEAARPRSAARPAPWWCAATSSASARRASRWRSACRPAATRRTPRPGSTPPSWPAPSACCGPATASCSTRCSPARTSAPRPRRWRVKVGVPFEGIWLDVPEGGGAGARRRPPGRRLGRHARRRRAPVRLRPRPHHLGAASGA